jgi:acyl transferase domain-containing protein/NADPH:quinone reductase-like Zn-dependent oxidoreductase/acyl carrier protein
MGHLEAASGVAGLVKVLHSLEHRVIAPTIGIEKLSPKIDFDALNIEVIRAPRPLPANGTLTMGVNSFGFGGVNAHAILQTPHATRTNAPRQARSAPGAEAVDFILSAKTPEALKMVARRFAASLRADPHGSLYDKAYQCVHRRVWLPHRAFVRGACAAQIADSLDAYADDTLGDIPVHTGLGLERASGPVFVYSGNGAQWAGMGRDLLDEPVFLRTIREIDSELSAYGDFRVEDELRERNGAPRFDATEYAQPALFAVQAGITAMLRQRGIKPLATLGHSVGEIAAAWCAGALTMADAVKVIFHRSRLQGRTRGVGTMTAVTLSGEEVGGLIESAGLAQELQVAGYNSPTGSTVAGTRQALDAFEEALLERRIAYKRLPLDYAFHCREMETIRADLLDALADIQPGPASIPFFSTVTGGQVPGAHLDANYWWRNIRQPVLFQQAMADLIATRRHTVFVEIGPHAVLRGYINAALKAKGISGRAIGTGDRGDNTPPRIEAAAADIVISGASVDWKLVLPRRGAYADLPPYPWQHESFWHPVSPRASRVLEREPVHPLLGYPVPHLPSVWESRLDTATQDWLGDHVVGDSVLFPAAGFAELALAAAYRDDRAEWLDIEELEIGIPLPIEAEMARTVRTSVDPADGRLSITVFDDGGDAGWVKHATGRVLRGSQAWTTLGPFGDVPRTAADITCEKHYALMRHAGLCYGAAFRSIDAVWHTGRDEVTARYTAAAGLRNAAFHLAPALLDGAFQLAFHLLAGHAENLSSRRGTHVFLPTKVGRITVRRDAGAPEFVHAQRLRSNPRSLLARFVMADREGRIVAVADDVRFRAVPAHAAQRRNVAILEQIVVPSPLEAARSAATPGPRRLCDALERRLRHGASHRHLQCIANELEPLLDILGDRYALKALRDMEKEIPSDLLSAPMDATIGTGRGAGAALLRYLVERAAADGRIALAEDGWRVVEPSGVEPEPGPEEIWLGMIDDYPTAHAAILEVARAGSRLPGILRGDERSPGGDMHSSLTPAQLRTLVQGSHLSSALDEAIADTIGATGGRQDCQAPLRILDIGGHVPALGPESCAALSLMHGSCTFAPAGDADTGIFEALRGRCPRARHAEIDDVCGSAERYDLIVLHLREGPLADNTRLLRAAADRLAAGGTLMICGHHPSRWMDLVFGAADSWWRVADGKLNPGQHPMPFWRRQLRGLEFQDVQSWETAPGVPAGPYFLIARQREDTMPAIENGKRWLVLSDPGDDALSLARHIKQTLGVGRGEVIHAVCTDASEARAALSAHTGIHAVINLVGFRWSFSPGGPATAQTALMAQAERCAIAASLAQAADTLDPAPEIWMVTRAGGYAIHPARGTALEAISDAAVWHFCRSLMNEISRPAIRVLDVRSNDAPTLKALTEALCNPGDEREIILAGGAARLVSRIVTRPDERFNLRRPDESEYCELAFDAPGQLHTLHWRLAAFGSMLADDEVEIEVAATGLNFRDVMYASGLLPDEGMENGFTGPSMGLEFSGTVLRTGAAVHHLAPGDRVAGFAPRSFSSRLRIPAATVAPLPDDISFEAAATIPSVFFTVYYALHELARLEPGEKMLVHGAAGGIGLAAIQFAKWRGAEIYATAGSPAKRDFLRLLGVQHIYDSRDMSFADAILRDTAGAGVDVVLNSLAGEAINRNLNVLRPFGRFVELGKRDFYENTRIGLRPFRNNISYFGVDADQLQRERPELAARLFKACMTLIGTGVFRPLPFTPFRADDVVSAFRCMQQARHIGKIVVHYRDGVTAARSGEPPRWEASGSSTYLVTGGTRGFGLRAACWLARKGARHIVLASRSGVAQQEDELEMLAALREAGVQVRTMPCDVSVRDDVESLLAIVAQTMPPLKGILHAATVIDDGLAGTQDAGRIGRAMAPKMAGAWHLHDLTRDAGLEQFILLSSVTALLGNPGQSAYVAANGWLEALARYRLELGLPATCLQLGPIDDAGFLARHTQLKTAMQSRLGGRAIPAGQALDILDRAIGQEASGFGFLDLSWRSLRSFLPIAKSPRFALVAGDHGEACEAELADADFRALAQTLPAEELQSRIVALLQREIAQILRMPVGKIQPGGSMYDLGLDSLMGVELIVALESATGARLPPLSITEDTTVEKLAKRVLSALLGKQEYEESGITESRAEQLASMHNVPVPVVHAGMADFTRAEREAAPKGDADASGR